MDNVFCESASVGGRFLKKEDLLVVNMPWFIDSSLESNVCVND